MGSTTNSETTHIWMAVAVGGAIAACIVACWLIRKHRKAAQMKHETKSRQTLYQVEMGPVRPAALVDANMKSSTVLCDDASPGLTSPEMQLNYSEIAHRPAPEPHILPKDLTDGEIDPVDAPLHRSPPTLQVASVDDSDISDVAPMPYRAAPHLDADGSLPNGDGHAFMVEANDINEAGTIAADKSDDDDDRFELGI